MSIKLITPLVFLFIATTGITQTNQNNRIIKNDIINKVLDTIQTKNIQRDAFSPFGSNRLSNFFSNVSVSSFFKEGVNGKIELQGRFNTRWNGGLSIDQKIGNNNNEATPLDLTGISPGTTVEFNLQKMIWKPTFTQSDVEIEELMKLTEAYGRRKRTSDSMQGIKIDSVFDPRKIGFLEIYHNGTDEEKRAAFAAFHSVKNPWFVNFRTGFTKTSFSYTTDSVMLKEINNAFITPTITISVVKALGDFKVTGYLALSYNYSESYTAADDITFSLPFGTTRNFYTTTVAFGNPTKKTTNNLIFEWRQNILTQMKGGNSMNIAISPSVNVGINSKRLSLFLPVYLIRGSDEKGKLLDGLQGGVRFGYLTNTGLGRWSSFTEGFVAQLIISQPLDFLGKF